MTSIGHHQKQSSLWSNNMVGCPLSSLNVLVVDKHSMTLMDDHPNEQIISLSTALNDLRMVLSNNYRLQFENETFNEIKLFYSGQICHNKHDKTKCLIVTKRILDEIDTLKKRFNHQGTSDNFMSKTDAYETILNDIGGDDGQTNQQGTSNSLNSTCLHYWQFWFWKADHSTRHFEWDLGLLKLAKAFSHSSDNPNNNVHKLRRLLKQDLLPVSEVVNATDYFVFREPIMPKWEDKANQHGGCWTVEIVRSTTDPKLIQTIWERMVESLTDKHCQGKYLPHICGLKINMRYHVYLISLWLDTFVHLPTILELGFELQNLIEQIYHEQTTPNIETLNFGPRSKPSMIFRAHKVAWRNARLKERNKFNFNN